MKYLLLSVAISKTLVRGTTRVVTQKMNRHTRCGFNPGSWASLVAQSIEYSYTTCLI